MYIYIYIYYTYPYRAYQSTKLRQLWRLGTMVPMVTAKFTTTPKKGRNEMANINCQVFSRAVRNGRVKRWKFLVDLYGIWWEVIIGFMFYLMGSHLDFIGFMFYFMGSHLDFMRFRWKPPGLFLASWSALKFTGNLQTHGDLIAF